MAARTEPSAPRPPTERDAEALGAALLEALDQQAATGEILRVIARSPADVQRVFETIANAALRMCRAMSAGAEASASDATHVP